MLSSARIRRHVVSLSRYTRFVTSRCVHNDALPRVTIDKEAKEAHVVMPGYNYGDLDRVDMMNFGQVMEIIARCRQMTWQEGFLDVTTRLRHNGMTFISGFRLVENSKPKIMENLQKYQESQSQSRNTNNDRMTSPNFDRCGDILFNIRLGYVGNSSFETVGTLALPCLKDKPDKSSCDSQTVGISPKCFACYDYTIFWVYLDRKSRKVSKLPDWFLEKHVADFHRNLPPSKRILIPNTSSVNQPKTSFEIKQNMIDGHGHTNNEVYMRFVRDVLENRKNEYNISVDMPLKGFEVLYKGESNIGDSLDIRTELDTNGDILARVFKDEKIIVSYRLFRQQNPQHVSKL